MAMQEIEWYTLNKLNARSVYTKGKAALSRLPKPKGTVRHYFCSSVPGATVKPQHLHFMCNILY